MRTTLLALGFLVACDQHHTRPDAATDGPRGTLCGGIIFRPCAANEYCDFANNQCGTGDQSGTCKPRPELCTTIFAPVCACDGKIYGNECVAYTEGLDLNAHGTCEVPSGSFACGYVQCDLATQYCLHEPQRSGPDTFTCVTQPACATPAPSCGCLAGERCGSACSGNATVGLTLICP